jgi:hypothetical protein
MSCEPMLVASDYRPPPALYWSRPDTNPFRGTRAAAIALLGIPTPPEVMQCKLRQIGDGERFAAMVFGAHSVEYDVIAEPARWPMRMLTSVLDCRYLAGAWEYHLLRPTICGNWSFERFPIAPGGLPGGGGWTDASWPGGWGESGEGGGYGGSAGEGINGGGLGGGFGYLPGVLGPTAVPTPTPISFTPSSPPLIPPFTPPVPPYTPPITPPISTPEPGSLAALLTALTVWAANRWRTLWGDFGRSETLERKLA